MLNNDKRCSGKREITPIDFNDNHFYQPESGGRPSVRRVEGGTHTPFNLNVHVCSIWHTMAFPFTYNTFGAWFRPKVRHTILYYLAGLFRGVWGCRQCGVCTSSSSIQIGV